MKHKSSLTFLILVVSQCACSQTDPRTINDNTDPTKSSASDELRRESNTTISEPDEGTVYPEFVDTPPEGSEKSADGENARISEICVGCSHEGHKYPVGFSFCENDTRRRTCVGSGEPTSPGCYPFASWHDTMPCNKKSN